MTQTMNIQPMSSLLEVHYVAGRVDYAIISVMILVIGVSQLLIQINGTLIMVHADALCELPEPCNEDDCVK